VRRAALSVALLAAGAAMLAAARFASASPPTQGIFRVGIVGASVQVDPQLAYITTAWWLEYATAAKLFNWPDRGSAKLVPEVASGFTVSDRGKRYTFFLRRGFRFNDGTKVTARNFAYAIDRTANKDLASPGAAFITDPNGTNIAGAQEVNRGNATHVSGVRVKGPYMLVIRLTKPDPSFVLKLTMPFFQATSTTLPLTHEVLSPYPSAGPYAYTVNDANVLTSIRRNPYYKRGPGRIRPRRLAGVDIVWGLNEQDAFQQVMANQLDETTPPASEVQNLANQFGVNKTRFWAKPSSCTGFLLLNTREGLLHNNLPMRQAINWAVDRTDYAATAGPYAGDPWTHLLPPRFPGSIGTKRLQPYAPTSRIEKARKLAAGHFGDGRIIVVYRRTSATNDAQGQLVRRDLIRLGFDPANIEMVQYNPYWGGLPERWDIGVSLGWCPDYTDPYDFFRVLLRAYSSFGEPNDNGVLTGRYRDKVEDAEKLIGNRRLETFGKLDLEITTKFAPYVPMRTYNARYVFSNRVDPRSLSFNGVYSDWSIPALALK
jgi:oligopeptide transport system substrate-binding protein